ncbi:hypothetical protein V8G61_03625 [Gaetbulibacter sp. M240]|uniref:hypothetical protein n=1 Tax=Gaetbulibacter sp. M240 TaxID=3126511 RepID=UPI00374F8AE6
MKNLIYLLILSLLNYNCRQQVYDENPFETTFLNLNDNTVWANKFENSVTYYRFINDMNRPLEYWVKDTDCYQYFLDSFENDDVITLNSKDTFEITIKNDAEDIEYIEKITLTDAGNVIKALIRYYENGDLYDQGTIEFSKSDLDVSSLKLCED